jgi:hypothetical protein
VPGYPQTCSARQSAKVNYPDDKLLVALGTGKSWRAVSAATGIPFSTVQKHARLLCYSPSVRGRETRHGG